ncbi:hypothetical protein [Bifidobacterium moukalabense]|uniref:hypothetical protein n=1 Tax=Bifidobacterium moukalabense TaxID=1333651 RepID=UPI0010F776F3|nr:hypothetical protein [Bifidobacterium moukalabense]
MSTNRRTEYDLINATARNTKRAANSAKFVAGATVMNTFETARLRRLQKENNDLQRRTQELQEESNDLQARILKENQEAKEHLAELGYNSKLFLQEYASVNAAARDQMAAELRETQECKDILRSYLNQSKENTRNIVSALRESSDRDDWRKFKADWLQTPSGKHYWKWCLDCQSTLDRIWKYHNAMAQAREEDR